MFWSGEALIKKNFEKRILEDSSWKLELWLVDLKGQGPIKSSMLRKLNRRIWEKVREQKQLITLDGLIQ